MNCPKCKSTKTIYISSSAVAVKKDLLANVKIETYRCNACGEFFEIKK